MSKERLEEAIRAIKSNWPGERYSMLRVALDYVISEAERVQELEKEFELCDSTMHMIDMTINNPSTSDDDKWEKVKKTIKKYYEDDCIHCNGKGFNGLDYCPNCTRGAVIQENLQLEQQNKRYREALEEIISVGVDYKTFGTLEQQHFHYTREGNIARKALEGEE